VTRILVTGTAGQLVTAMGQVAPAAGVALLAMGRPDLDLADPPTVARTIARHRPDVIINAAAYTAVDRAEQEPSLAHVVNALGAEAVAQAAASAGLPVIQISTDYVFDGSKPLPYVETDPVAPINVYGRTKLEGERRVAAASERHVIVRTAWVHGACGHNFVRTMLRLAASRPEIAVVDDQIGTPTYAPHLAAVIIALALRAASEPGGSRFWGVYHAAGSGSVSWCGLAREVLAVSGRLGGPTATVRPIATSDYPTPARRPANSRLDTTKLAFVLGTALPDWRAGVEQCVRQIVHTAAATGDAPRTTER
jgi:dTDP-4-dehydrorhamnose reductase